MSSEYLYQLVEFQLNEQHDAQMKRKFKQQFSHLSFNDLRQITTTYYINTPTNEIYAYDQASATWKKMN